MELKGFLFPSLLVLSLAANALAFDHLSASVYGSVNYGSSPPPPYDCPPTHQTPNPSPASPPPPQTPKPSPASTPPPPPPKTPKSSPASPPPPPKTPKPSPASPPPPPQTPKPSSPPPASPPPPSPKPSSPPTYSSPAPQTPKPSPPPPPTYWTPEKPIEKPKHEKPKKSKGDDNKHALVKMGVEGLIMCKDGSKSTPIRGAVARITCLAINLLGFETAPFSCLSRPTDKNGYFFASLSGDDLENVLKIIECKAFLESSPLNTCKVPTDINNGISGFPLVSFKILSHLRVKLYTAKPLYYVPEPLKSAPATPVGY